MSSVIGREEKDVKGDTEDNPQLSDQFLLMCQCFFLETKNPNYRTEDQSFFWHVIYSANE